MPFSHVARTGDIKQFVILEESGIAKGIRRIIAVTGHEAQEVTRQAETFRSRLQQVEKTTGKAKDAALKALTIVSSKRLLLPTTDNQCCIRNSVKRIYL